MLVGEILIRGGLGVQKNSGITKHIYKKMRNRVNTILRCKLGHKFIFVKMKLLDYFNLLLMSFMLQADQTLEA